MLATRLLPILLVIGACTPHRAEPEPKQLQIATAADSAFVRRVCLAPDSVLAGSKPCYEKSQKPTVRVF